MDIVAISDRQIFYCKSSIVGSRHSHNPHTICAIATLRPQDESAFHDSLVFISLFSFSGNNVGHNGLRTVVDPFGGNGPTYQTVRGGIFQSSL